MSAEPGAARATPWGTGELGSVLNVAAMPFNFPALLLLSWLWERCVFWGELMFELKPVSPSLAEQD